jgi:hypothetical protein
MDNIKVHYKQCDFGYKDCLGIQDNTHMCNFKFQYVIEHSLIRE